MPRRATTSTVPVPSTSTRAPSSTQSRRAASPINGINGTNGTITARQPGDSPTRPRERGLGLFLSGPITRNRRQQLNEEALRDASSIGQVLGDNRGADEYLVGVGSFGTRPPRLGINIDMASIPRSTPEGSEDLGQELHVLDSEMRERRRHLARQRGQREQRGNRPSRSQPEAQQSPRPNGADAQPQEGGPHSPLPSRRRERGHNNSKRH
ncbi:hypothetical protein B0T10DRAFT_455833 [Thelonectria olida]|uniref:Uncharacterized protein n=1 Tax=Thelonectria olida TaxID=1576542 RepID=A0A9P9AUD0_9HYPO|nr:hypothetical protein B0T10DRAFT_455833 [Thelonectria olida]